MPPFNWTFPYHEIPVPPSPAFPAGRTFYRPLLTGQIIASSGQFLDCILWPDSGADHCLFPLPFAIAIGLDPLTLPMETTGGVGSVANLTYFAEITVRIKTTDTDPPIAFTTMAGFSEGMDAFGCGLLGQAGFFERFPTAFEHASKTFVIQIPDTPPTRLLNP